VSALFYGVGATKSGTSWLYDYLKTHPQVHFRGIKELHYWDTRTDPKELGVFSGNIRDYREGLTRKLDQALASGNTKWEGTIRRNLAEADEALKVLASSDADHRAYLDYLQGQGGDARLVGEITPSYALLDEDTLRAMQALGPDTKFLYLIRDPVDRLWSHIRMIAHRRSGQDGRFAYRSEYMLDCALEGSEFEITRRGDYAATIERFRRVVTPGNLLVMFFEDMFTDDGIDHICGFLGLDPAPANFDTKVFHSAEVSLSDANRARAARALAPQYDYVEELLGRLPDAWQKSRAAASRTAAT